MKSSEQTAVEVFACKGYNDYYLYVYEGADVDLVLPQVLRQRLGRLRPALSLQLSAVTRLARADAGKVLAALEKDGFYLQLPPPTESR